MIFLEQTVNQILREEGQLLISLDSLGISWKMLEELFIGTYEEAKDYISIYDWQNEIIGIEGINEPKWSHVRHITYNAYNNMQRFMPDVPGQYWEFNPYTKNMKSLMSTNFSLEVGLYPTCQQLDFPLEFKNVKAGTKLNFSLPFTFEPSTFKAYDKPKLDALDINASEVSIGSSNNYCNCNDVFETIQERECVCCDSTTTQNPRVQFSGTDGSGSFDNKTLVGSLTVNNDYDDLELQFKTKYVGIKELGLNCELFYNWYKANVLTMIGAIKKQIDIQGVNLPFDFNQDDLLNRGRELMNKVEELKGTKSHWSNF